jgi:acetolactate synthase-1/3 small subunit
VLARKYQTEAGASPDIRRVALELTVNNHQGVMSQICGLFARRGYNVEGIVCMPIGSGEYSRIWLLADEEQRLDQIVKQVSKLADVLDVRHTVTDHPVFVLPKDLLKSTQWHPG